MGVPSKSHSTQPPKLETQDYLQGKDNPPLLPPNNKDFSPSLPLEATSLPTHNEKLNCTPIPIKISQLVASDLPYPLIKRRCTLNALKGTRYISNYPQGKDHFD